MGFVVRALPPRGTGLELGLARTGAERGLGTPLTEAERFLRHLSNPWDWGSFTWGFAVGGIVVTTLAGIVFYFAWPYVLGLMKVVPLFRTIVEEAKARGLL